MLTGLQMENLVQHVWGEKEISTILAENLVEDITVGME
jgi:hypothetical protein